MKSYPPYKIFFNFLLVGALVVFFFLIIPGERYEISDIISGREITDGGRQIRPPEFSGIMQHPAEIHENQDSIHQDKTIIFPDFVKPTNIEYPDGNDSIMRPFYQAILNAGKGEGFCRIVHIGDSQLEEDRITQYIRRRLNTDYNVLVDNMALRGSAGLEFNRGIADSLLLGTGTIEPDLLILQFGINVVPAKTDNFSYYTEYLTVQLNYLKALLPGVPVLLIGVSDMGRIQDGVPSAYPTVRMVSDAQRMAAKQAGTSFFDLQKFMGGPGSFNKWTNNEPALMRRDLTHFSFKGGEIVGEGIAAALIREIYMLKSRSLHGH